MKTKKISLMLMGLLFCVSGMTAQTYYYNATKTFYENGYTYQCDYNSGEKRTLLYNKSNKLTYAKRTYKNGSKLSTDITSGRVPLIEDDTWTKPKCFSIVNNAFSATEKQRIKGIYVMVMMTIDPATGKVIEVNFRFLASKGFGTIPVSVYRKIETDLKNQIWFTLTPTGKQLNFVKRGWMHAVE